MIIDNEESRHESLTPTVGCIRVVTPAASCPAVLIRTVGRLLHRLQIYKDISKLIVAEYFFPGRHPLGRPSIMNRHPVRLLHIVAISLLQEAQIDTFLGLHGVRPMAVRAR